jgi:hypothetical protein
MVVELRTIVKDGVENDGGKIGNTFLPGYNQKI